MPVVRLQLAPTSTAAVAAVVLLGFAFLCAGVPPLWHSDIWAHLKFGQWIVSHGALPGREPFSAFSDPAAAGLHYSWLSQAALFAAYHFGELFVGGDEIQRTAGGVEMLRFVHALMTLVRFGILLIAFRRQAGSLPLACAALAVVLIASLGHIALLRPQVVGEFFFASLLLALSRPRLSAAALIFVPLVMAVWANAHGSFLIGFVLLGICLTGRIIEVLASSRTRRFQTVLADDQTRRLTLVLLLSGAAVAALNPHGPWIVAEVLRMARNPNMSTMREWNPLPLSLEWGWQWHYFALTIMVIGTQLLSPRWFSPTQLLLLVAFAAGPCLSQRTMVWWIVVAPWTILPHWALIRDRWTTSAAATQKRPSWAKTALAIAVGLGAICSSPMFSWLRSGRPAPLEDSLSAGTPWKIAAQLKAEADRPPVIPALSEALTANYQQWRFTGAIFASEKLADYLLWSLAPENPVLVYTHIHLFPPDFWQRCRAVKFGLAGWDDFLDSHGVNLVVIEPGTYPALRRLLINDPRWLTPLDQSGTGASHDPRDNLFVALRKARPSIERVGEKSASKPAIRLLHETAASAKLVGDQPFQKAPQDIGLVPVSRAAFCNTIPCGLR